MKKLKLVNCHIAAVVVWVEPCDPVSMLLVMLWAAQPWDKDVVWGWHERRRLPRPQLPSFCLPVKAKPKVKVNGQGCDCHLRWARETLSWPSFLPITNLWTSLALAWWLISSATKTVAAVNFVFLMASAGKLPLDELPGSASSFWSRAVVVLNGWQCWVFTICVYLTESCGYCDGYGCGAGCILMYGGCM